MFPSHATCSSSTNEVVLRTLSESKRKIEDIDKTSPLHDKGQSPEEFEVDRRARQGAGTCDQGIFSGDAVDEKTLEDLPGEIIFKIFQELSPRDIKKLALQNRRLHALSLDWQSRHPVRFWIGQMDKFPGQSEVIRSSQQGLVEQKIAPFLFRKMYEVTLPEDARRIMKKIRDISCAHNYPAHPPASQGYLNLGDTLASKYKLPNGGIVLGGRVKINEINTAGVKTQAEKFHYIMGSNNEKFYMCDGHGDPASESRQGQLEQYVLQSAHMHKLDS